MTMVRKMAEAIRENRIGYLGPDKDESWKIYVPLAKACLSAMREPTDGMLRHGRLHVCFHTEPQAIEDAKRVYQAMIDDALAESLAEGDG